MNKKTQVNKQKNESTESTENLIEVGGSYSYTSNKDEHSFYFTVVGISDNKKVSIVIDGDDEPFIFCVDKEEIKNNINNKKLRLLELQQKTKGKR